jgi:hypothetical protein
MKGGRHGDGGEGGERKAELNKVEMVENREYVESFGFDMKYGIGVLMKMRARCKAECKS